MGAVLRRLLEIPAPRRTRGASILCRRRDRRHLPDPGQWTLAHRVDRRWPQSKDERRDEPVVPPIGGRKTCRGL